ncbi:hypothetical protein P691DRAFT_757727 [Macrolepiota fuliginosa MF-IS2]|uniref:RRM domain-containing protein n=1 Tax=Macrolepiota fuliginosa MF-IS2 TaxID=1400762 RepID=A0A9P6C6K0_9AGAR|nr:hypothetical protein P691DRAFT_757727 [Macrolepiota fuliginosa MF-IS2]
MSSLSSSTSSPPAPTNHKRKRDTEVEPDSDTSDSTSEDESENDAPIAPADIDEDAPVLSHAAQRKQKKLEKKKQHREDGETDSAVPKKKRKLKDDSAASSKDAANAKGTKRQNSVWVGNMSFKTTEENLRTFFKDRGVGDVTRINMPTKAAKGPGLKNENRGFAYVDFETPEAKQAAIALSEQPLVGRKLLIKDGDDFAGRPNQPAVETTVTVNGVKKSLSKTAQKILRNQKQPPAPTLFFGNLSFDTTEDSIRELLEAHKERGKQKGKNKDKDKEGEDGKEEPWIRKVRMGTFEDSGKCKGFAFVDFSTIEHATTALVNPKNHHLNGRDLVVEYASAEAVRRGAPKGQKARPPTDSAVTGERTERKPRTRKDFPPHKSSKPSVQEVMDVDTPEDSNIPNNTFTESRWPEGERQRDRDKGDRDKGKPRGRPKPGAALALAKRESAAIVPSQGQKITF